MRKPLQRLDTVALLQDPKQAGLIQGQVGTIVDVLQGDEFLVEFSGDDGKAYAILPIAANELLRLQFAAEAAE